MNIQQEFDLLARDFNLKQNDFYFLSLIPLIEMIWADNHNQPEELSLLYEFTIEHISALDNSSGAPFVNVADANDFLDRFAHKRPPAALLEKLRELFADSTADDKWDSKRKVLDYCLDIAASCTVKYPFGAHERIVKSEKELLYVLFNSFNRLSGSN
jgi:hypothetical protein